MEQCIDIGKKGEDLAEKYLARAGYKILHRNWRYRHWELDVIAVKENILHIIEIKTRSSSFMGFPEEKITKKKIQYLMNAAAEFLYQNPKWKKIQFNALSIIISNNKVEYYFIEDIYL